MNVDRGVWRLAGTTTLDREYFVTCGFAFSMNTPVKRLKIECFVCNTPNNRFFLFLFTWNLCAV
jgi:hypothetical protein